MRVYMSVLLFGLASCQNSTSKPVTGDGMATIDAPAPSVVTDANFKADSAMESKPDAGPFEPGEVPTVALQPKPGEVTFLQLKLSGILLGEAGIIIGPKGSIALLDVGNSSHDDDVRNVLREVNTKWLTPANGFTARTPLQVEWLIVTHWHADHIGGFAKLFTKSNPISVLKGVVHRGFVDLDSGSSRPFKKFCAAMKGDMSSVSKPLCEAPSDIECSADNPGALVATGCKGLRKGNLAITGDDDSNEPSYIDLDGARITFVGANGHFNNADSVVPATPFGNDTNDDENARSLVGVISLGAFRYHFGGDLHGEATNGQPDMESRLVETSGPTFYGSKGVDVTHSHHHARSSGSNSTFVAAMAPKDGLSRNVIAGISAGHVGSPSRRVLKAWGDDGRLGEGKIWITRSTIGGAKSPELINAKGSLVIQTVQGGQGYWVQAIGSSVVSKSFESVR